VGRGCQEVTVTNPYGCILGFLDRSRYYFFQVAPQLTERPPLICEVSANFCEYRMLCGQHNGFPRPYSRISRPDLLLFLYSFLPEYISFDSFLWGFINGKEFQPCSPRNANEPNGKMAEASTHSTPGTNVWEGRQWIECRWETRDITAGSQTEMLRPLKLTLYRYITVTCNWLYRIIFVTKLIADSFIFRLLPKIPRLHLLVCAGVKLDQSVREEHKRGNLRLKFRGEYLYRKEKVTGSLRCHYNEQLLWFFFNLKGSLYNTMNHYAYGICSSSGIRDN
jgi:hypothetical protein